LPTKQTRKRRSPILGDGGGVWSYVHIDDPAGATAAGSSTTALPASTTSSTTSRHRCASGCRSWPSSSGRARRDASLARLLVAGVRQATTHLGGISLREVMVNGQPGATQLDPSGQLIAVLALDITESGRIETITSINDPDKLRRLGPVAGAPASGEFAGPERAA
jgi:hypothetical protein